MVKLNNLFAFYGYMLLEKVRKFDEGHRALIYTALYKGYKVAIKKSKETAAGNTVANEAKWLKLLNKFKIGPRFVFSSDDILIYKFVDGALLPEFISKVKNVKPVLKKVLDQCRVMDKLRVNKEEMTNPYKHIFVKGGKVTMIDFERCKKTSKPKNVTQFCQYLTSGFLSGLLRKKGIEFDKEKMILLLKNYKRKMSDENYKRILKFIIG